MLKIILVSVFYFVKNINCKIIHIQAIFRHGDRTPLSNFPTDSINNQETWPRGFGQLTELGIQELFKVGQMLRKTYPDLLDDCSFDSQISFHSSFLNRTKESAAAAYMGMIDPKCSNFKRPIIPEDLVADVQKIGFEPDWSRDFLFLGKCQQAELMMDKYRKRSNIARYDLDNRFFFNFLSSKTGLNVTFDIIAHVWDILNVIKIHSHSHKMPEWASTNVRQRIDNLAEEEFRVRVQNQKCSRLKRGFLLWKIEEGFRRIGKIHSATTNSGFKKHVRFHGFSGHDVTIGELLSILGVYEKTRISRPQYGHCYVFEMHEIQGDHYIKLVELSTNSFEPLDVQISGCPELPNLCPWTTFVARNVPFVIENPKIVCDVHQS